METSALYDDPKLYDLLFPNAASLSELGADERVRRIVLSEKFYFDEARVGGPVLELACGTGRLTIPIAAQGIPITGLDSSGSMLAAAQRKAAERALAIPFIHGDMRCFQFAGRFSTIFVAGNSLLHLLTIEDLKSCLECARRHLAPGGRLVFDVFNPDLSLLLREPGRRYPVLKVEDAERGEIVLEETPRYDAAAQVRHITWYFSAAGDPDFRVVDLTVRILFPQELLLLLDAAGLRLVERYGEFSREPFTSDSPRQVCVCGAR